MFYFILSENTKKAKDFSFAQEVENGNIGEKRVINMFQIFKKFQADLNGFF